MIHDVAAWARVVKNGLGGLDGLNGQTESTKSMTSKRSTTYLEIAANGTLALIAVACSLLDRQIASLEKAFVEEGGFTERLYRVRSNARRR
jgi:four helix bundle suffix protein